MTDKPIIFSAPMVRALIEGRKTQTRRILKPQPTQNEAGLWVHPPNWTAQAVKKWGGACQTDEDGLRLHLAMKGLPYAIGDRLWVREAWKPGAWRASGCVAIDYRASPELTRTPWCPHEASHKEMDAWAAEAINGGADATGMGDLVWEPGQSPLRWRSPIHMPRWASRITLTVTDVRVQRLQEISEEDARAEGAPMEWMPDRNDRQFVRMGAESWATASYWFRDLWDSIHGDGAWDQNPWVCAVSFTVDHQGDVR